MFSVVVVLIEISNRAKYTALIICRRESVTTHFIIQPSPVPKQTGRFQYFSDKLFVHNLQFSFLGLQE